MKTLNRVLIVGHVGVDPELKVTQSEKQFLPISVATKTVVPQKKGDPKEYTEWHNVVFWAPWLRDLAFKMLGKGTPVLVEGNLRTYKSHDDMNDIDRYNTVVVADNFIVLNRRDDASEPTDKEMAEADVPF